MAKSTPSLSKLFLSNTFSLSSSLFYVCTAPLSSDPLFLSEKRLLWSSKVVVAVRSFPSPPEIAKGEEKKNKNGSDFFWGDGQKRGRSVGRGAELKVVPSLPPPSHFPAVHTGGAAARSGRRIEKEGEVCLFEVGWMGEEEEEGKGG